MKGRLPLPDRWRQSSFPVHFMRSGARNILIWLEDHDRHFNAIKSTAIADSFNVFRCGASEMPAPGWIGMSEVLVTWSHVAPPGILKDMPNLRWIQALESGVDRWLARNDLPDEVCLTSARGVHDSQMPDNIIGALYHITKPFSMFQENQRHRRWVRVPPNMLPGKTLGIVGLGRVGKELSRKASCLGMEVLGARRSMIVDEVATQYCKLVDIENLLKHSDFVVLLLPLTKETENIISTKTISYMKEDAWLLNFARGELIDDEDLIAAIRNRRIRGAVLDAFREEPLPERHEFWEIENILVLPHIGGHHPIRSEKFEGLLLENLKRYHEGRPLLSLVDRSTGY